MSYPYVHLYINVYIRVVNLILDTQLIIPCQEIKCEVHGPEIAFLYAVDKPQEAL